MHNTKRNVQYFQDFQHSFNAGICAAGKDSADSRLTGITKRREIFLADSHFFHALLYNLPNFVIARILQNMY